MESEALDEIPYNQKWLEKRQITQGKEVKKSGAFIPRIIHGAIYIGPSDTDKSLRTELQRDDDRYWAAVHEYEVPPGKPATASPLLRNGQTERVDYGKGSVAYMLIIHSQASQTED